MEKFRTAWLILRCSEKTEALLTQNEWLVLEFGSGEQITVVLESLGTLGAGTKCVKGSEVMV